MVKFTQGYIMPKDMYQLAPMHKWGFIVIPSIIIIIIVSAFHTVYHVGLPWQQDRLRFKQGELIIT